MNYVSKIGAALLAAMMALSAGPAGAETGTPIPNLAGVWQADNGESRYSLELCGDGTQLCATLTWIQPEKINDRNKPYIGKLVVDHARLVQSEPLVWKGNINVYGTVVAGRVTLVNPERFTVRGCALIFFCEETGANKITEKANR